MEAGEPVTDVGKRSSQVLYSLNNRRYVGVRGEWRVATFGDVPEHPVPANGQVLWPLVCLSQPRGHSVAGRFSLLERRLAALLGKQEIGVDPIPIRVRHDLPPVRRISKTSRDTAAPPQKPTVPVRFLSRDWATSSDAI